MHPPTDELTENQKFLLEIKKRFDAHVQKERLIDNSASSSTNDATSELETSSPSLGAQFVHQQTGLQSMHQKQIEELKAKIAEDAKQLRQMEMHNEHTAKINEDAASQQQAMELAELQKTKKELRERTSTALGKRRAIDEESNELAKRSKLSRLAAHPVSARTRAGDKSPSDSAAQPEVAAASPADQAKGVHAAVPGLNKVFRPSPGGGYHQYQFDAHHPLYNSGKFYRSVKQVMKLLEVPLQPKQLQTMLVPMENDAGVRIIPGSVTGTSDVGMRIIPNVAPRLLPDCYSLVKEPASPTESLKFLLRSYRVSLDEFNMPPPMSCVQAARAHARTPAANRLVSAARVSLSSPQKFEITSPTVLGRPGSLDSRLVVPYGPHASTAVVPQHFHSAGASTAVVPHLFHSEKEGHDNPDVRDLSRRADEAEQIVSVLQQHMPSWIERLVGTQRQKALESPLKEASRLLVNFAGKEGATLHELRLTLQRWIDFCGANALALDMPPDPIWVRKFAESRQDAKSGNGTRDGSSASHERVITHFKRFAAILGSGMDDKTPLTGPAIPGGRKKKKRSSPGSYPLPVKAQAIFEQAASNRTNRVAHRLYAANFALMGARGLRASEFMRLTGFKLANGGLVGVVGWTKNGTSEVFVTFPTTGVLGKFHWIEWYVDQMSGRYPFFKFVAPSQATLDVTRATSILPTIVEDHQIHGIMKWVLLHNGAYTRRDVSVLKMGKHMMHHFKATIAKALLWAPTQCNNTGMWAGSDLEPKGERRDAAARLRQPRQPYVMNMKTFLAYTETHGDELREATRLMQALERFVLKPIDYNLSMLPTVGGTELLIGAPGLAESGYMGPNGHTA